MTVHFWRALRLFVLLALFPTIALAQAPAVKRGTPVAKERVSASIPWLYKGSDVPVDREWTFGELSNGVRYAVRRNGVPPRQVSIRVAIDAGSLHERDNERGFAHFNEHLSFRGSTFVADGQAQRIWQRLGATFGSDTNAATSPTQTIYKLDLPSATRAGLDESVKILSGMMTGASLTQEAVESEKRTVLAELREGNSPQQRVGDATRAMLFAGQSLAVRSPIGTVASLTAATPTSLRAFRERWYRPERTVVVIVGDGDPSAFEALIRQYFSDWKGQGPTTPDPDFSKPDANARRTQVIVEPSMPTVLTMAVLRPWVQKNDTIEYNRGKLIDSLAARIINRRLETRARAGGSFLTASIGQDDVARSVDGTFIQVVPLGSDWQAAVRDVRGVIADALANPSSQADIDREAQEFAASLQLSVETQATQAGGDLADNLLEAVNIRETIASAEVARDVFTVMGGRLTPAAIMASTKALLSGTPIRAMLVIPSADPQAEAKLSTALTQPVMASTRATAAPVSFDRLPKLGAPATITSRTPLPSLNVEYVDLSNGVRLILNPNKGEVGQVNVQVRFGRGWQAIRRDRPTLAWAGDAALVPSGIADLGQEELDRLTNARRINMAFDIDDDGFVLKAITRASDFDDQMRMLATKLAFPGWDPAPVNRLRATMIAGLSGSQSSPMTVLGRELQRILRGGDARWAAPERQDIEALTPAAFRAFWEPLLKTGPIEVSIYGDIDGEKALKAAQATFGALASRAPAGALEPRVMSVKPNRKPLILTHRGDADQAAAVVAWPTGGGYDGTVESRKLDVLTAIFNDRLFNQLREGEGASYSPNVGSQWPEAFAGGGSISAISQLPPEKVDRFFMIIKGIATDLVTKPVTDDELTRAVVPIRQSIARAATGNQFWMRQLSGSSAEKRKIAMVESLAVDFSRMTPAELQATAKRWLKPKRIFTMVVLPEKR
jgi:zinc protease